MQSLLAAYTNYIVYHRAKKSKWKLRIFADGKKHRTTTVVFQVILRKDYKGYYVTALFDSPLTSQRVILRAAPEESLAEPFQ